MIWYIAHQEGHTVDEAEAPEPGDGGVAGGLLLLFVGRAIALVPFMKWIVGWLNGR